MNWPASLRAEFVQETVGYENQAHAQSVSETANFMNIIQGQGTGVDAATNPGGAVANFNKSYEQMQSRQHFNPSLPKPVGSGNTATVKQTAVTNTTLVGVHPLPTYPAFVQNSMKGEYYTSEKRTSNAREALATLALSMASSKGTTEFITQTQKALSIPTIAEINGESNTAVLRDTLIISKARAMIALQQYQATLMNQRLLASVLATLVDVHRQHILKLQQSFTH